MTALTTIAAACELVTDGTHFTPPNVGAGVPFLTVKDVTDSGLDLVNCAFISRADFLAAQNGNSAPRAGDVLFSKDGTVGKVHVVAAQEEPFAVLSSLAILRPDQRKADSRYLGHVLRSPAVLGDALKRKTGSAIRRIVLADLKQVQIPLPPLHEQRRIASILDKADELRGKRRAALKQVNGLTQVIFLEMFGDPATNPKQWRSVALRDLCSRVIDCPHSTPAYSLERTPFLCIRSSDIQNSELTFADTKSVYRTEYEQRIARGKPQRGDVIYCREGARFGNTARLKEDALVCLGQRMMLLRPALDRASSEFIWAFLANGSTYRLANSVVGGSAAPHVNIRQIVAFQVPLPPRHLQEEFSLRIKAVDKTKSVLFGSLTALDALSVSLQHRAFAGTL